MFSLTGSSCKAFPQICDGLAHLRQLVNMSRWFPCMSDMTASWEAFWATWCFSKLSLLGVTKMQLKTGLWSILSTCLLCSAKLTLRLWTKPLQGSCRVTLKLEEENHNSFLPSPMHFDGQKLKCPKADRGPCGFRRAQLSGTRLWI